MAQIQKDANPGSGTARMGAPSRVSTNCSEAEARTDVKAHDKRLQMSKSKD